VQKVNCHTKPPPTRIESGIMEPLG